MRPGSCEGQPVLDVVSAFQSYGKYLEQGATPEAERIRLMTVRNSCRKDGGSCGGECNHWSCTSAQNRFMSANRNVHCQHDGQCRRGYGNDLARIFLDAGSLQGEA